MDPILEFLNQNQINISSINISNFFVNEKKLLKIKDLNIHKINSSTN
jgi:hypothetical protein